MAGAARGAWRDPEVMATATATARLSPPAATFPPDFLLFSLFRRRTHRAVGAGWSCSGADADADADHVFSSGSGSGMAGTQEGSWFLARRLQSVGTFHVGFSSRCSPSTSLVLFSARCSSLSAVHPDSPAR
uniref:Uncharacterized protein n=1 Tax=Oryza meridionalis TaxID=40149 RepID=A0A0E0FCL8_9ORYZ